LEPDESAPVRQSPLPPEIGCTGFRALPSMTDSFVSLQHKLRASFSWRTEDIRLPIKDGRGAGGHFGLAYIAHPEMQASEDVFSNDWRVCRIPLGQREFLLLDLRGQLDIFASGLCAKIGLIDMDYRSGLAGQMAQRHRDVLANVQASTLAQVLDRQALLDISSRLLLNGPLQKAALGLQKHTTLTTLELAWRAEISDNCNEMKFLQPRNMTLLQGQLKPDDSLLFDRLDI
jgi:hypothetical protein